MARRTSSIPLARNLDVYPLYNKATVAPFLIFIQGKS